jgi:type IV pilus assembly protein PilZ
MTTKKTTKNKAGSRGKKTSTATPSLSAAPSPAGESAEHEGRTGTRVPIQLLVDYKAEGHYLFDFCKDLGTGGVFIQTTKALPTGAAIDLTFTIPDSKETLSASGTVIWVQAPVAERKDLTPGMGVQFSGFSGEQRKVLENFVERYHGKRYQSKAVKAG